MGCLAAQVLFPCPDVALEIYTLTADSSPKKVFLVGSGQRIRNNFIPGFRCLDDRFSLLGIHSRTYENAKKVADRHGLPAFASYEDSPIAEADVIVMSISTLAVPEVLKQLAPWAAGKHLVMDTPVLADFRHAQSMKRLERWGSVTIAEDYMNFPIYQMMRDVVDAGAIGSLRNVNLFHSGFFYHGLALIRSFIEFRAVRTYSRRHMGSTGYARFFGFGKNVRAALIEPYRSGQGRVMVVGTEGALTDMPDTADRLPHGVVEDITEGDRWIGHGIEINGRRFEIRPKATARLAELDLEKRSAFNDQKTCGLIEVLASIVEDNLNRRYGASQGLYDAFFMQYSDRLPVFVDPLAWFGGESVSPFFRALSRLKGTD
jgi:hypothetical protein